MVITMDALTSDLSRMMLGQTPPPASPSSTPLSFTDSERSFSSSFQVQETSDKIENTCMDTIIWSTLEAKGLHKKEKVFEKSPIEHIAEYAAEDILRTVSLQLDLLSPLVRKVLYVATALFLPNLKVQSQDLACLIGSLPQLQIIDLEGSEIDSQFIMRKFNQNEELRLVSLSMRKELESRFMPFGRKVLLLGTPGSLPDYAKRQIKIDVL